MGYYSGLPHRENPARWKGHLSNSLPSFKKRLRVHHHPAMPFDRIPEFMAALRAQEDAAARALEFLILAHRKC